MKYGGTSGAYIYYNLLLFLLFDIVQLAQYKFVIFCQKMTRELLVLVRQVILTPSSESVVVGQTTTDSKLQTSQVRD